MVEMTAVFLLLWMAACDNAFGELAAYSGEGHSSLVDVRPLGVQCRRGGVSAAP